MLTELVRAVGKNPDTRSAEGIGRLVAQLHTMRRMSVSVAGMLQAGKEPVVEASIVKDIGTVWEQALPHRVRDLAAFVEATERASALNSARATIRTFGRSSRGCTRCSSSAGTRPCVRRLRVSGRAQSRTSRS